MYRKTLLLIVLSFSLFLVSCVGKQQEQVVQGKKTEFQYKKWTVSKPLFTKGAPGEFDDVSVKDPSIVFYNGKYHLFYTSKAAKETRKKLNFVSMNGSGLGYASAATLEGLNKAKRYDLNKMYESVIVAPQVFYFEPQKLWYIIAQTLVKGRPDLKPIYMTNPDIEDINGWTKPKELKTGKINNGFWIDFWIICDDEKAHLFYTDHEGSLFRFECQIEEFPNGFANRREETVLIERGENEIGRWRLHEASHIYHVKKENKYLCLLEAVYPHPTRKNYWDSRNRFLFGMVSDKLEGPWTRVEAGPNEFIGDPAYLYNEDGTKSKYDQVSHPELIRSGYNQKLEIEDYNLQLLFQAFDAENVGPNYDYNELPWELMLMKNF